MTLRFLRYKNSVYPSGVVGLVDANGSSVTPLSFPSGVPVAELYDLIEHWDAVKDDLGSAGPAEAIDAVQVQAPLTGRDVLAIGKNYKAHAKEFQTSGYDSSDKNEQPTHPVIFTKRASSIVPTGSKIYPHPNVTDTLDYEGELGVIIGKAGIAISKEDAWKHVWGACVINDVTARERQRDHKQFYVGKSLDTFCPMGPYAVHSSQIDWKKLVLTTRVNGETRQEQNTSELIFDIPTLIETASMGITLQPGDVIATGTPAGVGIGRKPPIFLKAGDKIEVEIGNLGTLVNEVAAAGEKPPVCEPVRRSAVQYALPPDSLSADLGTAGRLHLMTLGDFSKPAIVFIHGLGGSFQGFEAAIKAAKLADTHYVIGFDLRGHGLSPLGATDQLSFDDYIASVGEVMKHAGVQKAAIVAHSMGGLIATNFAARNPDKVTKLVLVGGVKAFPDAGKKALTDRAANVRKGGMSAIADAVTSAGTSQKTASSRPLETSAVRASLLASPAEGYAQACLALAQASDPDYSKITVPTLILAGSEDKTCPKATVDFLSERIEGSKVTNINDIGHWHQLEDHAAVAEALRSFL